MASPDPSTRPQLAVSAVIFRDGKVLLVRRARSPGKGFYSLPGGRVEFGESLYTALAREVDEETGLQIDIVGLAGWRLSHVLEFSAAFQEPEMVHARAVFARKVEPGAVVITTEDVGRPAENIEYYSGVAHALYLTDLERWGLTVGDAAELLARGGMPPYLLLPKAHPGLEPLLAALGRRFAVELAADIPARRAIDYFVAAAFLPDGIHMQLYHLGPLGAGVP